MKLLIATESDAVGQVYAPIAREMLDRGHEVHVYSRYLSKSSTVSAYHARGVELRPLETLWGHEEDYDFALVYREVQSALKYHKVPTGYVLFGPHSCQQRVIGAQFFMVDLMFVASENNRLSLRRSGYNGEIVVTGLPKYDELYHLPKKTEKLIVVPDSPNSPRGEKRARFFETLVQVARRFPDYEVVIKPRTTLSESFEAFGFMLGNDKHMEILAQGYPDLPANLRVLKDPTSMNELAARAELMITVPGSAAFGQMLLDKPVLLVADAVHPDELVHNAMYRANLDIYLQSGCGVWMDELPDHVPHGVKAHRRWVEQEIGPFDGKAAFRVADALETAVEKLGRDVGWFPVLECRPEDMAQKLDAFRAEFDALDSQGRERLRLGMLSRKVTCGVQSLKALVHDLVEDLDLTSEIDQYQVLAERLLAMDAPVEFIEDALYPLFIALGELADRIWSFRTNQGYFKQETRIVAEGLVTSMGLRLGEHSPELAQGWAEQNRGEYGHCLLDMLMQGPGDRNVDACKKIVLFLAERKSPHLAARFALRCMEEGEYDFPRVVLDSACALLQRRNENERAKECMAAWEQCRVL